MEASFEVGQGPKVAVAPYMDASVDEWMVTDKPEGGFGDVKKYSCGY
jgi:hypothetical protein